MDGTGGTPLGVAVARVWDGSGHAVGGAFLAAPGCLLTAAHVVNLALGRSAGDTARPDGDVWVDFPVLAPRRRLRAEVAHWVPPGQDSPEDIAGLRLLDGAPEAARPVPLVGQRDPFDRRVVMFGFPAMLDDGVWSVGRLRGPQGSGWVQIDVEDISQFTIQGGFSGVPVWDVDRAAAVGMVVAAWRGTRVRTGYMIPADALFAAWPDLHRMARPPSPFRGLRAFGEQIVQARTHLEGGRGRLPGLAVLAVLFHLPE